MIGPHVTARNGLIKSVALKSRAVHKVLEIQNFVRYVCDRRADNRPECVRHDALDSENRKRIGKGDCVDAYVVGAGVFAADARDKFLLFQGAKRNLLTIRYFIEVAPVAECAKAHPVDWQDAGVLDDCPVPVIFIFADPVQVDFLKDAKIPVIKKDVDT